MPWKTTVISLDDPRWQAGALHAYGDPTLVPDLARAAGRGEDV